MHHITLESENEYLKEIEAASTCPERCREFVDEYKHILFQIIHPEKSFPPAFVSKLEYWERMFEENQNYDPRTEISDLRDKPQVN